MITWILFGIAERRLLKRRLKQVCRSTFRPIEVIDLISTVEYAHHQSRPFILSAAAQLLGATSNEKNWMRVAALKFLLDRLTSAPISIIRLTKADPVMAGPDTASLYRGMFEATVNFLYLLDDHDGSRLCSFCNSAYEAEKKMYDAIEKWESHPDPWIATYAHHQLKVQDPPCESARNYILEVLECTGKPAKYPNIYERCTILGSAWEFLYDAMYRGLSAWQHGDMSRSATSSSLMLLLPEYAERTVFESLIVLMWTWELTNKASVALCEVGNKFDCLDEIERLNRLCQTVGSKCMGAALKKFHNSESRSERSQSEELATA